MKVIPLEVNKTDINTKGVPIHLDPSYLGKTISENGLSLAALHFIIFIIIFSGACFIQNLFLLKSELFAGFK